MTESNVVHDTFVIHRRFPKSPAQVYAAFANSAKKRRWFAEGPSHDVLSFQMDFRVGGVESAQYRLNGSTPFPGVELMHNGTYIDIVPEARIVVASTMAFGGKRISATLVTFEILQASLGSTLVCTHQAVFFEGADGPDIRRAGMESLLDRLAHQVAEQENRVPGGISD